MLEKRIKLPQLIFLSRIYIFLSREKVAFHKSHVFLVTNPQLVLQCTHVLPA